MLAQLRGGLVEWIEPGEFLAFLVQPFLFLVRDSGGPRSADGSPTAVVGGGGR